ncbi:transcription termination factor NusA [Desulfurivibrio alkaliphilus]|uniref:Transcription termination/antitermination protein NusA n=1 Tax=Desulfurivibrio alkaliphilus (strain DSM 19089 / UNIQEM U267 / AHT2) TaxID=589865 RepID=D6Z4T6_DESAT|nr:transcription termination factor NusA [Desulfurivibrio alkaliphilus]ADH86561.1 transcription termination factor NusA [Desulfurivibrio alkaliphilus AHT 2]
MISELKRIIDQISRDKGINRDLLIEAIEEAVMSAAKKKYGHRREIEARYNDEYGEIELFQFRTVVDEVTDEQTEISLAEAKELDPEVEMGDELGSKMDSAADLGRIAAQSAKQVIIQKMKEAESDVVYDLFKERKGDIVNGIVQRFERGNMIVNLGRTDAILPSREQMPRKSYRQGDRIRAYLLDVRQSSKEPQLVLSRTCNEFLTKLFTMEVPEIAEGIVKVMGVAREPGSRAKIAVSSTESDVDPVGACVGMKGSRVQNVVQELQGEKIDIVPWSPDPARYVSNALAPAQVSMVVVDEENNTLLVVVPDDQLSLAIGRQGQNVRLASALLGWRIDVKSETRYSRSIEEGFQSLLDVAGISEKQAEKLYDGGISSAAELAAADPAEVATTLGLEEPEAQALVSAASLVEPREEEPQEEETGTNAPVEEEKPEAEAAKQAGEDEPAEDK